MSELTDTIEEYVQNTQELVQTLEKEASEAQERLAEAEKRPLIEKSAAIEVAGTLIGRGLISADNLSQTIEQLCADPLGVIAQISKTASAVQAPLPSVGAGTAKKSVAGAISTENLSNADKALFTHLRLM